MLSLHGLKPFLALYRVCRPQGGADRARPGLGVDTVRAGLLRAASATLAAMSFPRRTFHRLGLASAGAALLLAAGCSSTGPGPRGRLRAPRPLLTPEQASDMAMHALGLVGTPYRYGGNTPEGGFDCSGLIGYVYRSRAGTPPPRTVAQLDQWGEPVEGEALRSGDLVVFGRGRAPSHAGIYVGDGRFVHAPSSGGTVRLDRLDARHWVQQRPAFRRP